MPRRERFFAVWIFFRYLDPSLDPQGAVLELHLLIVFAVLVPGVPKRDPRATPAFQDLLLASILAPFFPKQRLRRRVLYNVSLGQVSASPDPKSVGRGL